MVVYGRWRASEARSLGDLARSVRTVLAETCYVPLSQHGSRTVITFTPISVYTTGKILDLDYLCRIMSDVCYVVLYANGEKRKNTSMVGLPNVLV